MRFFPKLGVFGSMGMFLGGTAAFGYAKQVYTETVADAKAQLVRACSQDGGGVEPPSQSIHAIVHFDNILTYRSAQMREIVCKALQKSAEGLGIGFIETKKEEEVDKEALAQNAKLQNKEKDLWRRELSIELKELKQELREEKGKDKNPYSSLQSTGLSMSVVGVLGVVCGCVMPPTAMTLTALGVSSWVTGIGMSCMLGASVFRGVKEDSPENS